MALCDVDSNLGDQGIGSGDLGERESRDRELTDAQDSDPELRNANEPRRKLADGDYTTRHDGSPA